MLVWVVSCGGRLIEVEGEIVERELSGTENESE